MALSLMPIQRREGVQTTLVAASLVYVGMRVVSAVLILVVQRHQPVVPRLSTTPYLGMTMHWDALWFEKIARHGYPHRLPRYHPLNQHLLHLRLRLLQDQLRRLHLLHAHPAYQHLLRVRLRHLLHVQHLSVLRRGAIAQNQWAFFAGFPYATRAVMALTAASFPVAATLLNLAAGIVAACAIALLLATRIPRAATIAVVGVWSALPMAPTFQLAYSEALAMALLALALLWLVREQWGRATVAALLLGVTRPILPPLAVVYGVMVWRRLRRRARDPLSPWEWTRMLGGLVLTAAGSALWSGIAWWATGIPGAYVQTEAAWHHGTVTPFAGLVVLRTQLSHGHLQWREIAIIVAICVAVVLALLALRSPRLHPALITWCWAYLVYDLAVASLHGDELRMLLPLFPLVAVACGVASRQLAPDWRVRAWVLAGAGIVGQYLWLATYVRYIPGMTHAP